MEYKDNNKTGDIILADFKFYQISIESKSDSDLKIDTKSNRIKTQEKTYKNAEKEKRNKYI